MALPRAASLLFDSDAFADVADADSNIKATQIDPKRHFMAFFSDVQACIGLPSGACSSLRADTRRDHRVGAFGYHDRD